MRKLTDEGLARLDHFLVSQEDDEVMMVPELDGFLTGLLVCPEMILPSEWLPVVWGGDGPVFEGQTEANEILGLIMALYNDITSRLDDPDTYEPLIEEDIDGTFLWEFWAEGFGKAIALRPRAWSTFKDRPDDDQAADAFGMLVALATIARATDEDPDLYDQLDEQVSYEAPQMIATCVMELHHDRLSGHQLKPRTEKVGRNDPCPCGSGKKYKKCCLQAQRL
jgi:uncharacterized protein